MDSPPAPGGVVRRRRPPGADRARGDLAVHAAQAAARAARRRAARRRASTSRSRPTRRRRTAECGRAATTRCAASSGIVPTDRVSARAWAAATGVFLVDVPAEAELGEPRPDRRSPAPAARSRDRAGTPGHHGRRARARRPSCCASQGSATLADNVEIVVGDGAAADRRLAPGLGRRRRAPLEPATRRSAATRRSSTSRCPSAATWCATTRPREYAGPGGDVEMLGLYFADAGQHIEHRLFVDHNAAAAPRSHVIYKGALQGQGAHTVWIGNVLIRKAAEGIETYEENRNLVLTDGCQADSVPNLEIETGEIEGAGHASATGRFDDEQLFYLRSRGIEESEARRLVVHGFFNDLIRKIGVPELEEQLVGTVEAELAKNVGRREGRDRSMTLPARLRARRARRRQAPLRVEVDGLDVAVVARRRRGLRDRGRVQPRRGRAVRGRRRGLHDRVLAARLALRPPHRQAHRPAGHRTGARLSRRSIDGDDVYVDLDTLSETTDMATLEIKDLHVSVDTEDGAQGDPQGRRPDHQDGETHAIMGPNGSGKSTLAYSIAGHPKYHVTSGSVTLDGVDVLAMTRRRAGARRAVPGDAVPRRGARRLGLQLPAHREDRHRRRGAQAAHLGQGRQRGAWSGSRWTPTSPALGQRGLLRRREEAPRDRPARAAQPQGRGARRDRLRPRHRRAEDRLRGRQPLQGEGRQGRPADHALHPDPALHHARLRARLRRRPGRRGGRPRARRRSSRPRATTST